MSAIEKATTTAMKPRKNGPIDDCVKLWIELMTPLLVRNVPKSESAKAPATRITFQTRSMFFFSCTITECRNGGDEPGHERGVLDGIPGVPAAPPDLLVGPLGAEEDPDAEERPGRERPATRDDDPALVHAPGEASAAMANANGIVSPT